MNSFEAVTLVPGRARAAAIALPPLSFWEAMTPDAA